MLLRKNIVYGVAPFTISLSPFGRRPLTKVVVVGERIGDEMTLLLPVVPGLPCDALNPRCSLESALSGYAQCRSSSVWSCSIHTSAPCSLEFVILPLVDERNIPGVFGLISHPHQQLLHFAMILSSLDHEHHQLMV